MGKVSYGIHIKDEYGLFRDTIRIFREAVKFLIPVCLAHWTELEPLTPIQRQRAVEILVHGTRSSVPAYPAFDRRFYKFPSYFRRSAITVAVGAVDKYQQELVRWEQDGRKTKRPHLNTNQSFMPCFFRNNTFRETDDPCIVEIKVFMRNDWVYVPVRLKAADIRYFRTRFLTDGSAPVLRKANHRYLLQFTFDTPHSEKRYVKDIHVQKAIGVDLGINTDAVCSAILRDGTVTGTCFINSPVEKDRLSHLLNQTKRAQQHHSYRNRKFWRWIHNYQDAIAIHAARSIVTFAQEQDADVIVFEHLGQFRKPSGSKAQRLSLWRKREIQHRVEAMAQRLGIRVSYVNAKNTSDLAFDGSGTVVRDKQNYSYCTFTTGKRYHCDLSASKNIGARYLIRAIQKSMPETVWSSVSANVPGCGVRTMQTLATLIGLVAEVAGLPAAV